MGTSRPLIQNLETGELERVATPLLDQAEASTTPSAGLLPRADGTGKLALGWVPVAADGEVSAVKVVRADDSRLGNPTVGGDLSGTASSATVAKLRGRTVATTAPADGQVMTWDDAAQVWTPETPTSGGTVGLPDGGTTGQVLTKTTDADDAVAWADPTGGGGASPASRLYLHGRFR
ncbi:MAG: hypothetical protein WCP31_00965 [Chloroflexales bacterium]